MPGCSSVMTAASVLCTTDPLKNLYNNCTVSKPVFTRSMLPHTSVRTKFKRWARQCTYIALGVVCMRLNNAWTPVFAPAITLAQRLDLVLV